MNPQSGKQAFLGTWELQPKMSEYEHGEPPQSNIYTIRLVGDRLVFTIDGRLGNGTPLKVEFEGIPDGLDHKQEDQRVADTVATVHNPNELTTISKKNGAVLLTAHREMLPDGKTMKIVQSGTAPDGSPYRNTSYYKKRDA
jgi:hypothetical protein